MFISSQNAKYHFVPPVGRFAISLTPYVALQEPTVLDVPLRFTALLHWKPAGFPTPSTVRFLPCATRASLVVPPVGIEPTF